MEGKGKVLREEYSLFLTTSKDDVHITILMNWLKLENPWKKTLLSTNLWVKEERRKVKL